MRKQMRAYEGETCTIYYSAQWYTLLAFIMIGMMSSIGGLTLLVALGAEVARTGTLSRDWLIALPFVTIMGGNIALNAWMVRRRPMLLISVNGIGYITTTCTLWTDWANVESMTQTGQPCLLLRQAGETTGIFINKYFTDTSIPLWIFDYTPRSALARDLRAYAPQLFK